MKMVKKQSGLIISHQFTLNHAPWNKVPRKKKLWKEEWRKKIPLKMTECFLAVALIIIYARKSINAMKKRANGNLQADKAEINTSRPAKCMTWQLEQGLRRRKAGRPKREVRILLSSFYLTYQRWKKIRPWLMGWVLYRKGKRLRTT